MALAEQHIDIDVPVHTAYERWTRFEEFPTFMNGVHQVTQFDDGILHWVAEVGGLEREWEAEIVEDVPDSHIAWRSLDGVTNAGLVTFHELDDGRTRVRVQIEHEPDGMMEEAGVILGADDARLQGDLERFRTLVEACARDN